MGLGRLGVKAWAETEAKFEVDNGKRQKIVCQGSCWPSSVMLANEERLISCYIGTRPTQTIIALGPIGLAAYIGK